MRCGLAGPQIEPLVTPQQVQVHECLPDLALRTLQDGPLLDRVWSDSPLRPSVCREAQYHQAPPGHKLPRPQNHPLCSASYISRLHIEQTKLHVRDIGLRIPEHTQPRAGVMTDQAAASLITDLV